MLLVPVGRSPAACARSRRGRRVPAPTARAMGAGLPRPRSCPRRAMLLVPVGRNPAACARSRRGRRVPAPTTRAMGAGLPRPRIAQAFRVSKGHKKRASPHRPACYARPPARTSRREVRRAHRPSECIRIARLCRAGGEFAPAQTFLTPAAARRSRRQSRRRSRRPAQTPAEKIGASRAFPTRS